MVQFLDSFGSFTTSYGKDKTLYVSVLPTHFMEHNIDEVTGPAVWHKLGNGW